MHVVNVTINPFVQLIYANNNDIKDLLMSIYYNFPNSYADRYVTRYTYEYIEKRWKVIDQNINICYCEWWD
jgi:hypothetical protein